MHAKVCSWTTTLSLSAFNLGSLGVVGVTLLIGVSKGMASLIPGPIIIPLGVQLHPFFRGRVFGKLRSLRGWLFLCGQWFMGRSLHWIILCLGGAFWWISVVLLERGNYGSSSPPLSYSSLFVGLYVSDLWDSIGHARLCGKLSVLLELLAGKIYFKHLEYGSWLFDVDCLDGKKSALFWGYREILGSITSSMLKDFIWLV